MRRFFTFLFLLVQIVCQVPAAKAQRIWHFEQPENFLQRTVSPTTGAAVERETTIAPPASIDFDSKLYFAWVGTDANNSINLSYTILLSKYFMY